MDTSFLAGYAPLGLLLLLGVLVFTLAFGASRALRPSAPSVGKETSYECGLDPVDGNWAQMQVRYYVYAFLYALFAVEAVFLFPWAVVFDTPEFGMTIVVEMAVFVSVITLGLAYAWRKGVLTWQ